MKFAKNLLLGTTAGLMAVATAQAADMPVKAKPVLYVKICTLYGDGFYYIPGTNTCLKLGGYVRVQAEYNAGGGGVPDGWAIGGQQLQAMYDRVRTNDVDFRVRGALSLDVRDQTEYGTLRSYFRIGMEQTTPANGTGANPFWDRAFIQWAGFTVGKAQSFFDIVTYGGAYSYHNVRTVSDTGASGWNIWAYTAQFGNGFSGTLSVEDPNRARAVVDTAAQFLAFPAAVTLDNAFGLQSATNNGFRMPDIVLQLRVDQAWGYAAVAGAIHDLAAAYYGGPPAAIANTVAAGHPADKKGWAVNAGALFKLPGGDAFGIGAQYSQGAAGYGAATNTLVSTLRPGTSAALGFAFDGVFNTGGEIELTTVWNVIAFYEHVWNARWKTSIFGGYVQVDYGANATRLMNPVGAVCNGLAPTPFGPAATATITLLPGNSCDPDFSFWQAGTRTQWNPHPNLDIGLEVLYTKLNTAYKGPALVNPGVPQQVVPRFDDQDVVSAFFRWQRNFYP